ncbi:MAG TPA: hypothetical protein ENI19_02480 [Candidatus Nealsonbacteria bacterium]|uniref:Dockerin domain-containing protein n=1 Tax=marine sediment metagenome TaxID=412755 RepID=A0A0F9XTR6_9ZZZZ|nr:hypothetical protein [Candidatus Nealsonbacteria bacterium]HEB46554.1 hypothetical protein [Candidatus Nealsonbacteria bacterium]
MKKEELEKKLENINLPHIEIQSHQQRLKMALLNSGYFKEKIIMSWTKKLVPAGIVLALVVVLGVTVVNPKLIEAKAMAIAKNDPQIQKIMKETGAAIREVKIKEGKGYVLFTLPEDRLPLSLEEVAIKSEKGEMEFFVGTLVLVDLKEKRVDNVEILTESTIHSVQLTDEEKAKVIGIAKNDLNVQEMIGEITSTDVEINVKPTQLSRLFLEEYADGFRVSSWLQEEKKANVVLKISGQEEQKVITVNLTQEKVESTMSIGTIRPIIREIGKIPPCGLSLGGVDIVFGDINLDGYISKADSQLILEYVVGKQTLTWEQLKRADVDGNKDIDSVDAMFILQYAQGLRKTFPVCEVKEIVPQPLPLPQPPITRRVPPCGSFGDVDKDGFVTDKDSNLVLSHVVGDVELTEDQKKRADVDNDGKITSVDALFISQYIKGLKDTFPVCSKKPVCSGLGDVDNDGFITAIGDSQLVLKFDVGLVRLTDEQKRRADVNGDGNVNSVDAMLILRSAQGMGDDLWVCKKW